MSDSSSSIRISVHGISIEITGSEDFVSEQVEIYQDLFLDKLKRVPTSRPSQDSSSSNPERELKTEPEGETEVSDLTTYEHIYSIYDDDVRLLLNEIPGSSYRDKTANAALLYLFGKHLAGVEEDEFDTNEIRDMCQEYGCLDGANFMRHLKSEKRAFIVSGSGRSHTIKLTHPGRQEAKDLIEKIEEGEYE